MACKNLNKINNQLGPTGQFIQRITHLNLSYNFNCFLNLDKGRIPISSSNALNTYDTHGIIRITVFLDNTLFGKNLNRSLCIVFRGNTSFVEYW